jgi:hypothetical protein
MASTIRNAPASAQDNRFDDVELRMAKAVKKVDERWKTLIGEVIDYAIARTNRTQKEAWVAMGHNDGAELNRWIAGQATPRFAELFAVDWLRVDLVIALASLVEGIETETTLRIVMRRAG